MRQNLSMIVGGVIGGTLALGIPTYVGFEAGNYIASANELGYLFSVAAELMTTASGAAVGTALLVPGILIGMVSGSTFGAVKDVTEEALTNSRIQFRDYWNRAR